MGYGTSKSFTEEGVKLLYQYFLINILQIFLVLFSFALILLSIFEFQNTLAAMIIGVVVYFIIVVLTICIVTSGELRYILIGIVILCFGVGIFVGIFALVIELIMIGIFLFVLIWGISYIFIGRNEFDKKHKIFVIIAFAFSITYFVLFLINAAMLGFTANLAISSYLFTDTLIQTITVVATISVIMVVLGNLAFVLFVYNLSHKKNLLWIAFALGVASLFTFSISGIVSLVLFYMCYKEVYESLYTEKEKPTLKVPCPYCNEDIPFEAKEHCPSCGAKFEEDPETSVIDPRLEIKIPKPRYNLPQGYTPVKGPTEEQKRRVFYIIGIIIIVLIVVATLVCLLR